MSGLKIFGGGMAGLLTAHMMRRHEPIVYEAQKELPNNHAALLRFRSTAVAEATHTRFKKVLVRKFAKWRDNILDSQNVAISNQYSYKVTGEVRDRSILKLDAAERYIAPPDFIQQLSRGLDVRYDSKMSEPEAGISTIPMPALMAMTGWEQMPDFKFQSIWSVNVRLCKTEVYQTIYYPESLYDFYRASITGDLLIVEYIGEEPSDRKVDKDLDSILQDFGIPVDLVDRPTLQVKHQKYGKLLPIDDRVRRSFILWATDQFGLYSIGRFATWRQILMDDVVEDVKLVEGLIEEKDLYQRNLHVARMRKESA